MKLLATLSVAALAALTATTAFAQYSSGDHRGPRRDGVRPPSAVRPLPPQVRPVPRHVAPRHVAPRIIFTPMPRHHVWTPSLPYAARYHDTCHQKAWRLRWYERRASADGYFSGGERADMAILRRDLDRTCGGWRWNY